MARKLVCTLLVCGAAFAAAQSQPTVADLPKSLQQLNARPGQEQPGAKLLAVAGALQRAVCVCSQDTRAATQRVLCADAGRVVSGRASLLDACPGWLTWLRYTAFIGLYPVGVVAEMVLLYLGVPYVREHSIYSWSMPNAWNFAWDHALFVQAMLVLYPYLWWQNYSSLLRQRSRKVGQQSGAAAHQHSKAE